MAIDPVCGMTVDPQIAKRSFDHEGETYYFCSKSCLERFRGNPAAYLNGAGVIEREALAHALLAANELLFLD